MIGPNGPYRGKLVTDGLDKYDAVAEGLALLHYGCLAEPYAYLCHLFEEFPQAKTAEQLEALLPWNAKATLDAAAAQAEAELAA